MYETLLLGLLLTLFGLTSALVSRRGRPFRIALGILFPGMALTCLAGGSGISGEIAAGCLFLLGGILSVTADSEQAAP